MEAASGPHIANGPQIELRRCCKEANINGKLTVASKLYSTYKLYSNLITLLFNFIRIFKNI